MMKTSVGETLKQARLDKNITIKKASQATTIRASFLEALEADNIDALPSPVQARGFLRIYAEYLGLDTAPLLAAMRGEEVPQVQNENPPGEILATIPDGTNDDIIPSEQTEGSTEDLYELSIPPELVAEGSAGSLPTEIHQPVPLSQSIFIEIGQQLKGRRELLSLTLDEIERHTRIRKHYLAALEVGAIDDLPSPVQARGILSSYAKFLDLDVDALLLRYAEGLQASRLERHPESLQQKKAGEKNGLVLPSPLQRIFSTDVIFGGGMVVAMVVFALWGANRIISQKEQEQGLSGSQQSISEALLSSPEVTAQAIVNLTPSIEITLLPTAVSPTPTVLEIPAIPRISPVQVTTVISGETWMRVTVDGRVVFQGRATAGSASVYEGTESVAVLTADGSQVKIIYNQADLGPMGDPGAITEVIYTPKGAVLPTPTRTPLPTRTPRVTPTFTPSITPTPVNPSEP